MTSIAFVRSAAFTATLLASASGCINGYMPDSTYGNVGVSTGGSSPVTADENAAGASAQSWHPTPSAPQPAYAPAASQMAVGAAWYVVVYVPIVAVAMVPAMMPAYGGGYVAPSPPAPYAQNWPTYQR